VTGPVDLVGLSWGGWITAHFTASHPARVRTLTLIDPAAGPAELPTRFGLPIIGPWFWQVTVVPGLADGQMSDFLHPERYPTWADQYRPQMRYKGFGRALLSTLRNVDHTNLSDIYRPVGQLETPVLLVWGRQDQTVSFENSAALRQAMPQLEFAPIDSAGHVSHIEQAQQVNARLIGFFEEHPAGSAP
jgi:pimeloyl-ACP methyl ester carboxylesterase